MMTMLMTKMTMMMIMLMMIMMMMIVMTTTMMIRITVMKSDYSLQWYSGWDTLLNKHWKNGYTNLPSHVCPVPVNPVLHAHVQAPAVLVHRALASQSSNPRTHSSKSGNQTTFAACERYRPASD